MKFLYVLSICVILLLGVLTSYSDIRFKKAYNKHLLVFLPLGVVIQIMSIISSPELLLWIIINIITTAVVSIIFYSQHIWAAGDAKLFIVMILLIPYQFYNIASKTLFPAFYCLSFVFTVAIVYIIIESLILLFKEYKNNKFTFSKTKSLPTINSIKEWLLMWLTAFLVADTFDQIILQSVNKLIVDSGYLIVIINILISIFVLSVIHKPKYKRITCGTLVVFRIILSCFTQVVFNHFTITNVFIIVISIIIRNFANRYNYRTIATKDIQIGDILAQKSILGMIPSTVKGLPKYTDETIKCRLNEVEVAAIKRWKTPSMVHLLLLLSAPYHLYLLS